MNKFLNFNVDRFKFGFPAYLSKDIDNIVYFDKQIYVRGEHILCCLGFLFDKDRIISTANLFFTKEGFGLERVEGSKLEMLEEDEPYAKPNQI